MVISRLAPTPSGFLHVGNALNLVLTWALTRQTGGILWLRIDDMDQARVRDAYLDDIFQTLDWLGLEWDKGPTSVKEHKELYAQSLKVDLYLNLIQQLEFTRQTFACQCSRKDIQQLSSDGQYPGTCKSLNYDYQVGKTALRVQTDQVGNIGWQDQWAGSQTVDLHSQMRDFVIRRKDGIPAYQIVSLTEDIENGINLIVRGADLMHSTAAQLYLASLLKENTFLNTSFYHHPLIQDKKGVKLSKSEGAMSLKSWRAHHSSTAFYQWMSQMMGWEQRIDSPKGFLEQYSNQDSFPSIFSGAGSIQ